MKIQKMTLTDAEVIEAVHQYLKSKGIELPIERVFKSYTWETEFTIEIKEDEKPVRSSPPCVPEPEPTELPYVPSKMPEIVGADGDTKF